MILIEVEVPSVGRHYDFQLDETVRISALIPEIAEVISKREDADLDEEPGRQLCLAAAEAGGILRDSCTLSEYGITNGSRLILI